MYKIMFLGWCTRDGADKIWGVLEPIDKSKYGFGGFGYKAIPRAVFWAGRGQKLRFKQFNDDYYALQNLIVSKFKKGYIRHDETKIEMVWPGFKETVEQSVFYNTLAGNIQLT